MPGLPAIQPTLPGCSPAQAAGEAEAALFRLRTLLAHVVTGRHGGHRAGARPSSGAALACLDELQQLLQYLQASGVVREEGAQLIRLPRNAGAGVSEVQAVTGWIAWVAGLLFPSQSLVPLWLQTCF